MQGLKILPYVSILNPQRKEAYKIIIYNIPTLKTYETKKKIPNSSAFIKRQKKTIQIIKKNTYQSEI